MEQHTQRFCPIEAYRSLFVNRTDTYARQNDGSRSYHRVKKPLTDAVLRAHLRGDITVGLYSLGPDGKSRWGCIDSDEGEQVIFDIRDELGRQGVPLYVERSRQGAHGWVFLEEPLPGVQIKHYLEPYARGLELFPSPGIPDAAGVGLLVRGPLGVHRYTGERYPFLRENGDPVSSG